MTSKLISSGLLVIGLAFGQPSQGTPAKQWSVVIEAEDSSSIQPPAHVVKIPSASNGSAVSISAADAPEHTGKSWADSPSVQRGELGLDFELPNEGRYFLWARIQWHCLCAREIGLTLTAHSFRSPFKARSSDYCVITSYGVPSTWQWLRIGNADFGSGKQSLRFLQRDHLALVDAVAISTDPDYAPPGYKAEARSYRSTTELLNWQQSTGDRQYCRAGDQDWSDFVADVYVLSPTEKSSKTPRSAGVSFCMQPDDSCYEALLITAPDQTGRVRLSKIAHGNSPRILRETQMQGSNTDHYMRILRDGEEVSVWVDGNLLVTAEDAGYFNGNIGLIREGYSDSTLIDLNIHDIRSYTEIFAAGAEQWNPASGSWRVITSDATDLGGNYFGSGPEGGLTMAPWTLGDNYSLAAQVRAVKGDAGLAFDIADTGNFSAVVVGANPDDSTHQAIKVIENRKGVSRTLWKRPISQSAGQWCNVHIEKSSTGVLAVAIDGGSPFRFQCDKSLLGDRAGLYTGLDSAGAFTRVKFRDYAEPSNQRFVFRDGLVAWSPAHWRQISGRFTGIQDPAHLSCLPSPDKGQILLELRSALSGELEANVVVPRHSLSQVTPRPSVGGIEIPAVPLPVLPNDPRFGIRFTLDDPPSVYEASLDLRDMKDLVISRDSAVLAHKSLQLPADRTEVRLFFRVRGNSLEAGVDGVDALHIETQLGQAVDARSHFSLFGAYLHPDQELSVMEIEVKNLYPPLYITTGNEAGGRRN